MNKQPVPNVNEQRDRYRKALERILADTKEDPAHLNRCRCCHIDSKIADMALKG